MLATCQKCGTQFAASLDHCPACRAPMELTPELREYQLRKDIDAAIRGKLSRAEIVSKIVADGFPEAVADQLYEEIRSKVDVELSVDRRNRLRGLIVSIIIIAVAGGAAALLGVMIAPALGETPRSLGLKALWVGIILGMYLSKRALYRGIAGIDDPRHHAGSDW